VITIPFSFAFVAALRFRAIPAQSCALRHRSMTLPHPSSLHYSMATHFSTTPLHRRAFLCHPIASKTYAIHFRCQASRLRALHFPAFAFLFASTLFFAIPLLDNADLRMR